MRVRIGDLGPAGLELQETLDLARLNERLNGPRDSGMRFVTAPAVSLKIRPLGLDAEARGTVRTEYEQACGRCMEDKRRPMDAKIVLTLKRRGENEDPESAAESDQDGLVYFEGDHVDLEATLQELLILGLNLHWLPETDDSGRCVLCKKTMQDLIPLETESEPESKTSLGDLLAKAKSGPAKKRGKH
jgi:uncharacterized metal-binding protein YceD (DUF177 family)